MKTLKNILIPMELHRLLKAEAAKQGKTIMDMLIEIIKKHLGLMVVMVMVVGCAHNLVPVDKTNYARFEHDQKVLAGMDRSEVLQKFGTPNHSEEANWSGKNVLIWNYNRAIFCGHESENCAFYFDRDNRLFHTYNVRMEFNYSVVGK